MDEQNACASLVKAMAAGRHQVQWRPPGPLTVVDETRSSGIEPLSPPPPTLLS